MSPRYVTQDTRKTLPFWLNMALEYGPLLGFVATYLLMRSETFVVAGTPYSGLVAVTAMFIPIFVLSTGLIWLLTGRIARVQMIATSMIVVFGGVGIALNDPRYFQMKPTAIYLVLALVLGLGLLRGKFWLKYLIEDILPMKRKGWLRLTQRTFAFCLFAAGANELVWRTQSERFWVLFETLAMPALAVVFFVYQIGLFITYASAMPSKSNRSS